MEKLAYGVKCCAIAKHVRLANVTANAELKPVRTNTVVQAGGGGGCGGRSCLLHLPLTAVSEPAAAQPEEG